ncbi:MAG TPA: acyl-CoA dehydrogenase family protein, partial [Polyangiaceae bacterium]
STLGQQLAFQNELRAIVEAARANGMARDVLVRQRIAQAWIELRIMRLHALRTLSSARGGELPREAMVSKLHWSNWHRGLGELAMDVLGAAGTVKSPEHELLHRLFLFSRADTIYAGSSEIQRSLIGERALGLPR